MNRKKGSGHFKDSFRQAVGEERYAEITKAFALALGVPRENLERELEKIIGGKLGSQINLHNASKKPQNAL